MRARRAAGFSFVVWERVMSSMSLAPFSMESMSMPWRAAGRRPTTESSLVRPPTQSQRGKVSSQWLVLAKLSNLLFFSVMATACLLKSKPAFL